mgnify:FL=1
MNEPDHWQENNAQRLSSALVDLRARLERLVSPKSVTPTIVTPPPAPVKSKIITVEVPPAPLSRSSLQRMLRAPVAVENVPPEPDAKIPAEPVSESPAEPPIVKNSAPPALLPWAMDMLAERLGLSVFEQNLLLLSAAPELDTRISGLCARTQDDSQKAFPTFALALALFDSPSWDALSPERPLRYWRLIEIYPSATQALTASPIRADERIVSYLKGLNFIDDRLAPFFSPLEPGSSTATLSASQEEQVGLILSGWQQSTLSVPLPAVQLVGVDPLSKQLVASRVAARLSRRLFRLNAESLPASVAEIEMLARLWQRESRLLPLALYFDAEEVDGAENERSSALARFLTRSDGVFFVGIREFNARLGRAQHAVDISKPTTAEQQDAWASALGSAPAESPAQLAAQFNLNLPAIESLAQLARTKAKNEALPLADVAWEVCRKGDRPKLDALAQRLDPKMTWDDLVLPKTEADILRQIAAQTAQRGTVYRDWGFDRKMNRGFGISALFAGESGTGKTMAAEVIAQELKLNLYRIDLSQVVNKYIGETEKNLRRLFDAAEDGGAILFFDEADALFGKRSEVKDSHDRYANIEINYLLQRMESYRGLAILATNQKSALDPAFIRRLRFIVNFHFPTVADRRRLWSKAFMQHEANQGVAVPPIGKIDCDRLAALNFTGGHIHNVALNAAFLAAHRGSSITMPIVLEAARNEFRKLDRPINESEFKWEEPAAPRNPDVQKIPVHA